MTHHDPHERDDGQEPGPELLATVLHRVARQLADRRAEQDQHSTRFDREGHDS